MSDYAHVTDEMFDKKLTELTDEVGAEYLLTLPGVYEIVKEHFNNEVLESFDEEEDEEDDDDDRLDTIASRLSRDECIRLLRSASIECYDDEDTATLREAVAVNLKDGTLDENDIEA